LCICPNSYFFRSRRFKPSSYEKNLTFIAQKQAKQKKAKKPNKTAKAESRSKITKYLAGEAKKTNKTAKAESRSKITKYLAGEAKKNAKKLPEYIFLPILQKVADSLSFLLAKL